MFPSWPSARPDAFGCPTGPGRRPIRDTWNCRRCLPSATWAARNLTRRRSGISRTSGRNFAPASPRRPAPGLSFFPSGTAHQVMPAAWARQHLPGATFAFHASDGYAGEFAAAGLRLRHYRSPEEMIALGAGAGRVLATDSFPSHLWQVFGDRVVLLMSQQIRARIVHPGFPDRQVVASRAPCCPCSNLDRGNHPLCAAGRVHCATWADPAYVASVERMLA